MFVFLIQLCEFLLWSNTKCEKYNKTVTNIMPMLLYIQPFLIYIFNIKNIKKNFSKYYGMITAINIAYIFHVS